MRTFLLTAGVLGAIITSIYFIGLVDHPAYDRNSGGAFATVALWSADGFWWKLFVFGGLAFGFGFLIAKAYEIADGIFKEKHLFDGDAKGVAGTTATIFVIYHMIAALAAYHIEHGSSGGILIPFSILARLPYTFMFFIIPGLGVLLLFVSLYPITAAVIYLTTRHPATGLVERSAARKRPDPEVEASLAALLRDFHANDRHEADRLINELSPFRRWKWSIRAKKHAEEAKRLGKIARTRSDSLRADTSLMHDVHGMERAKRNQR